MEFLYGQIGWKFVDLRGVNEELWTGIRDMILTG